MTFKRILVGIDRSTLETKIFEQAINLAQTNSAELKLVHCLNQLSGPDMPLIPGSTGINWYPTTGIGLQPVGTGNLDPVSPDAWRQTIENAEVWLQDYAQQAIAQGIPTAHTCQVGDPGSELCQLARDWSADLIIIGRRGYRGLTEALLGSVSNHIVHHAPCSVLIVQDT